VHCNHIDTPTRHLHSPVFATHTTHDLRTDTALFCEIAAGSDLAKSSELHAATFDESDNSSIATLNVMLTLIVMSIKDIMPNAVPRR